MRTHYKWVLNPGGLHVWRDVTAGMTEAERDAYWQVRDAARQKRQQARANHGGWRLAAYHWEHVEYPQFQKVEVSRERAAALLKRLARHFKTSSPTLSCMVRRGGGGHYTPSRWGTPTITLGKDANLGLVCHEYAHHLETVTHNSRRWHGKQFKRELKKVYTFAKRYLPEQ